MGATTQVPARLKLRDRQGRAVATVLRRSLPARVLRALLTALGLWAAGAFCVLIPLLHFVLVPGFAVAGLVMLVLRLREAESLVALRGECPECRAERDFPASGGARSGRQVHCDGCGSMLTLELGGADGEGASGPKAR